MGRLQKLRVQGRHEDYKYTLASHGLAGGAIEGAMTTSPPPREWAITRRTGRTGA